MSTLDIIELEQGAHYVLTAKLNQDPLEALLLLFNSGMHTNFVPIVGSFFFFSGTLDWHSHLEETSPILQ